MSRALSRRPLRITLTLVVVVLIVASTALLWWRYTRPDVRFTAQFTSAQGIYPGSQVRILGVPVGTVDAVTPNGATVTVAMHLDPGCAAAAATGAVIINPNLVSDRYVQLTAAYVGGPKLADGAAIPVSRTATPVELDQLYTSLIQLTSALGPKGANAHGALSRLLDVGAANLAGNGQDINDTISQVSQATTTLAGSASDIFGTLDHLNSFTGMLQQNNDALTTLNDRLATVSQVLADDRQSFGQAMQALGQALALVQGFVQQHQAELRTDVDGLTTVAQTLVQEQNSLEAMLKAAPLLTQNFANAYDAKDNVLRGRINPKEVYIWAGANTSSAKATGTTNPGSGANAATSGPAPAGLLPPSNTPGAGGP
jgi:phospholipid/cholesterol/gamma-HCH transport system substrate-binding protein